MLKAFDVIPPPSSVIRASNWRMDDLFFGPTEYDKKRTVVVQCLQRNILYFHIGLLLFVYTDKIIKRGTFVVTTTYKNKKSNNKIV